MPTALPALMLPLLCPLPLFFETLKPLAQRLASQSRFEYIDMLDGGGFVVLLCLCDLCPPLPDSLPPDQRSPYRALGSARRKKEFLAVREILSALQLSSYPLQYLDTGKPFLAQADVEISISHAARWVGVAFAPVAVGLDIQHRSPKIERVFPRISSPEERALRLDAAAKAAALGDEGGLL